MAQQRIKLFITEVGEVQTFGERGGKKVLFKAKNPEGNVLQYVTYNQKHFELLKKDTEIDVDVDTTERQYQDQTFTDRKIVQIYVNGQPVTGKAGGGWRGKSPEEIELEKYRNRSIEAQTCLKEAVIYIGDREVSAEQTTDIAKIFLAFIDEAHKTKFTIESTPKPQSSTTPPPAQQEGQKRPPETLQQAPGEETPKSLIDVPWFWEMMAKFQKAGIKKWGKAMVLKSLNTMTGRQDTTIDEALKHLTKEQADAITINMLETYKML